MSYQTKRLLAVDLANIAHQTCHSAAKNWELPDGERERVDYYARAILVALMNAAAKIKPERIVVAREGECWRSDFYPQYKANREQSRTSDEIKRAIGIAADFLENYTCCHVVGAAGAEGDDVIGVLAREFGGGELVILSNDGDFNQLLELEKVIIYDPRKREYRLEHDPFKLFLKYWRGDSGDNIPNISNRKREKFIRGLYESAEAFSSYLAENPEFKELFERNKKLITLDCEHIPEKVVKALRKEIEKEEFFPRKPQKAREMARSKNGLLKALLAAFEVEEEDA